MFTEIKLPERSAVIMGRWDPGGGLKPNADQGHGHGFPWPTFNGRFQIFIGAHLVLGQWMQKDTLDKTQTQQSG